MGSYKKLVRDKIPEIIKENGEVPITRTLDDEEYKLELLKKLREEVDEVIEATDESKDELVKELGDVQEVLLAIYDTFDVDCSDVTETARKRRKKRGAFKEKIYLEGVE